MRSSALCPVPGSHRLQLAPALTLPNGTICDVRPFRPMDIGPTGTLIRTVFSAWAPQGVYFDAAHASDAVLSDTLLRGGIVFCSRGPSVEICATVTLDHCTLVRDSALSQWVWNIGDSRCVAHCNISSSLATIPEMKDCGIALSLFAVAPSMAHRGVGRAIYDAIESAARCQTFGGIVLGTYSEARWLYDWYHQLGFTEVGWKIGSDAHPEQLSRLLLKSF